MPEGKVGASAVTGGPLASFGYVSAIGGGCKIDESKNVISCPEPNRLSDALEKYGPLIVGVDANAWQWYNGGIIPDAECAGRINHAVVLIGKGGQFTQRTRKTMAWGSPPLPSPSRARTSFFFFLV